MNKIDSFQGEYRWLSNFFIEPDGTNLEAEYQAAKAFDEKEQSRILGMKPGEAKRAGRKVVMRLDWDLVKIDVMRNLLAQKFADKTLAEKLLATGDAELIEGNTWGDQFWGIWRGEGQNNLGKLLMELRTRLKTVQNEI